MRFAIIMSRNSFKTIIYSVEFVKKRKKEEVGVKNAVLPANNVKNKEQ